MTNSHHRVLGVNGDVNPAELKAAFRKLAHRYHPDISNEENAKEKFIEVVEAYRALTATMNAKSANVFKKTAGKRRAIFTPPPPHATASAPRDHQPNEPTCEPAPSSRPEKGKDCHMDAFVSVEELYWGAELKVNPSSACCGTRKHRVNQPLLHVKIPRGTKNGAQLRLAGKGAPGKNGGANGDIYLAIRLKHHERYDVSDDNLYVDLPLSRWEAEHGAIVDVVTPGGRIEVDVPAGISSGQSIRILNRGLPQSASKSGDLFAVARLVTTRVRSHHLHKWPHIAHADSKRWRLVGGRHGNTIDVRI